LGLGALDLSDLNATSSYADTADSEARHLLSLGRIDEAQKLETEVYDLAEKVLVQRPSDLHSLMNRYFAAQLLGKLADRRHDDASAADYATRSAQAGEDYVRFNPSDLTAWTFWTQGLRQVADQQLERGEVTHAIATLRMLFALEQDKRRPSSLGPVVWYQWITLANLQAQVGDSNAAAQSLKSYVRDTGEYLADLAADDPRRSILAPREPALDSSLQLIEGATQAALTSATAVIDRIGQTKVPASDMNSVISKNNGLSGALITASRAAIRLGRPAQAESLARQLLTIPADSRTGDDPLARESRLPAKLRLRALRQRAGAYRGR